jgi:hypothetical protein
VDVETPSGGRDKIEMDQGLCTGEEEDSSTGGTPTQLDLGGLSPFQWNIGLGRPGTSPLMTMTSSSLLDVLGGRLGSSGTCGRLEKPKEG